VLGYGTAWSSIGQGCWQGWSGQAIVASLQALLLTWLFASSTALLNHPSGANLLAACKRVMRQNVVVRTESTGWRIWRCAVRISTLTDT
jgi:hypothetical protein